MIDRFIECLIPENRCNLKCEYCYVSQNPQNFPDNSFDYPISHIINALSKERLGTCFFSLCGAGETLLKKEVLELTIGLIRNGHYVNITTNGLSTSRYDKLLSSLNKKELSRVHFSFSLHYDELVRTNNISLFLRMQKDLLKMMYQ